MIFSFAYINILRLWKYMWKKPEPTHFKHDITLNIIMQTTPSISEKDEAGKTFT